MDDSPIVRLYRFAYEGAHEPTFVLASDRRVLFANRAAREWWSGRLVDAVVAHIARAALSRARAWAEIEIDHVPIALDARSHGDQVVIQVRERAARSRSPGASTAPAHGGWQ